MSKIETLESLINETKWDKVLKEETENHFKFTLSLNDYIVMISTPKEEVEVYVVSLFKNREVLYQEYYYNTLFIHDLKKTLC